MILNEDEVKIKTIRWMREHADYLRELKGLFIILVIFLVAYLELSLMLHRKRRKESKGVIGKSKKFQKGFADSMLELFFQLLTKKVFFSEKKAEEDEAKD